MSISKDIQSDTQTDNPTEPTVITHDNTIPEPTQGTSIIDDNDSQGAEDDEVIISEPQPETEGDTPPSLEDFLSKLTCTGCGKHCSLLYPRCGRGNMQAQQAEEEYMQTYYSA